jgi:hypothetical protein
MKMLPSELSSTNPAPVCFEARMALAMSLCVKIGGRRLMMETPLKSDKQEIGLGYGQML